MWTPKQVDAFRLLSHPKIQQAALLGGSGSGKSYVIGHKFRQRGIEFPGSLQIILRKTMADCRDTVWSTMMINKVLKHDIDAKICTEYKQPAKVVYKNGSEIRIGGLHPSEIDKVLGPDYATIWPNEASEVSWKNVPALRTRLRDRTPHYQHGRSVKPMIVFDFNPPTVRHWTHSAFIRKIDPDSNTPLPDGDSWGWLRMNPYDNRENLDPAYLATLESMSERDKQRFLYGEFGQLKGLVYDNFDPEKHVFDDLVIPASWPKFRAFDFGFVHPFAGLWGAYDSANETLWIYREWYHAGLTINDHAKKIKELSGNESYASSVADHDAGERAVLAEAGIQTTPATKEVIANINVVYDLLSRGKLKIHRSCQGLINEMYSYQWKEASLKEEPVKLHDDAINALQYMARAIYRPKAISTGRLNFM